MKISSKRTQFTTHDKQTLSAKYYYPSDFAPKASVFIVPVFSESGMDAVIDVQKHLAHKNISSFVFEYRGIGDNTTHLGDTSIATYVRDTKTAYKHFFNNHRTEKHFVLGYCIGGHIVPQLLNIFTNLSGLILISPSVYSKRIAQHIPLTDKARDTIRKYLQDENSQVFTKLKKFTKKQLILFGEKDENTKPSVLKKFETLSSPFIEFKYIPNGMHSMMVVRNSKDLVVKNQVLESVSDFIDKICTIP